jgi:lysophospholipase L1-like esterase
VSFDEVNQGRLMIVLTFGQSQAANYGETEYCSKENVYNYYNGKFYTAVDPLLGATGKRGSVWTRLGDKIIEQGLYDNVLFVPIAVGASGIESWSSDGNLYHRITDAIDGLRKYKLEITHMFWSQGSYDSWQHTPEAADEYKAEFMEMVDGIREYGVTAPIYVSVETYSYGNSDPYIQQAQRDLVNIDAKIYPGPNNDEIKERWDGVHFSNKGLDKLANLWFEIIKEYVRG